MITREKGWDDQFTLLQGEVYGLRILEAEPANGAVSTLYKTMKEYGHSINKPQDRVPI